MLALAGTARATRAEDSPPTGEEGDSGEDAGEGAFVTGDAEDDELFLELAREGQGEVIEVWDERPDKPYDRDTELRLTGEELARRGATDLAEAIELLPDVRVRAAGRGGRQIDIRGARKGSVKILIDGIDIRDPYYGNLDISSIPVTDIVQIRVSKSSASPIDGPGGPGGVIEVHTRDAIGTQMIRTHVQGSTLPSALASATARTALAEHLAVRASATGTVGLQDFTVIMPSGEEANLGEDRQEAAGALRLEYREGERRLAADVYAQHKEHVVPPAENLSGGRGILVIGGESRARASLSFDDDDAGEWQLQGRGYYSAIQRDSTFYSDPGLEDTLRGEDLFADRFSVSFLANRPLGKTLHFVNTVGFDSENADVVGFDGTEVGGRASVGHVASALQYQDGPFDLDAAAGVSVPVGIGADPWPELKLSGGYRPVRDIRFELIGGRKGRVPTLRERFRFDGGNEELGPEQVLFGEAVVSLQPHPWAKLDVTSFLRRSNGLIRFDGDTRMLINTGELTTRGAETQLELGPEDAPFRAGAAWTFTDAFAPELGVDPLDFMPRHRLHGWVKAHGRSAGATARVRWVDSQIDQDEVLPTRTAVDVSAYLHLLEHYFASARLDANVATGSESALFDDYQIRRGVLAPGLVFTLAVQGRFE